MKNQFPPIDPAIIDEELGYIWQDDEPTRMEGFALVVGFFLGLLFVAIAAIIKFSGAF